MEKNQILQLLSKSLVSLENLPFQTHNLTTTMVVSDFDFDKLYMLFTDEIPKTNELTIKIDNYNVIIQKKKPQK